MLFSYTYFIHLCRDVNILLKSRFSLIILTRKTPLNIPKWQVIIVEVVEEDVEGEGIEEIGKIKIVYLVVRRRICKKNITSLSVCLFSIKVSIFLF